MLELAPGTILGGYRVEEVAGRGGAGVVYRAIDTATGDVVAIKTAREAQDPTTTDRLRREAQLLESINHPGVVGFRELLEQDGSPFLVTNWVPGRPLSEHMGQAGPMPVGRALKLLAPLAKTLDHLHRSGTVHRDLSPANIMLHDETLTLIDLGVGRGAQTSTVTMDGATAGTPRYMAPEVIRGTQVDGRADQYSVATLLAELLTGEPPLPGTDQIVTALHHQLNTQPVPLTEVDPYLPLAVEQAVLRGLSKDPEDRYETVTQLVEAAASPATQTGGTQAATPLGETLRPKKEENKTAWLLPVLAFLVVAGVAAWVINAVVSDDEPNSAAWTAGNAQDSACNLITQPDFESGILPVDYYALPADTEEIVAGTGLQSSAGLQVGRADQFGQYAELVPVEAGTAYVFGGWFSREDQVGEASIGITWLDFTGENQVGVAPGLELRTTSGDFQVVTGVAPPGAALALPYVFKDSSPGLVFADELIFGPQATCTRLAQLVGDNS